MPESFERGALTEAVFYILLSLHEPMHGYAIMQNIEKLTAGRVVLGPGTLYGAINALTEKQWIAAVSAEGDSRKKEYVITESGRAAFRTEIERLKELLRNGDNI
jgi:DNA-binding PadR family transcriptional regulator